MGVGPAVEGLPEQPGDVGRTRADFPEARRHPGNDLSVSIEEGIGHFVDWHREHAERLAHERTPPPLVAPHPLR